MNIQGDVIAVACEHIVIGGVPVHAVRVTDLLIPYYVDFSQSEDFQSDSNHCIRVLIIVGEEVDIGAVVSLDKVFAVEDNVHIDITVNIDLSGGRIDAYPFLPYRGDADGSPGNEVVLDIADDFEAVGFFMILQTDKLNAIGCACLSVLVFNSSIRSQYDLE